VQVTVVVPTGKKEPELGEQVTVPQRTASAVGAGKATTAPHKPGSLFCVMFAGHVMLQHATVAL
jgi:hypothetical protein